MTKLKTLKDFSTCNFGRHEYDQGREAGGEDMKEYLRDEAIKWINHLAKSKTLEDNDKVNWIAHFFNITDEDLK